MKVPCSLRGHSSLDREHSRDVREAALTSEARKRDVSIQSATAGCKRAVNTVPSPGNTGVLQDRAAGSSWVMTGSAAVSYVDTLPYNSRTMGGPHRRGTVDNTPKLPLSFETECRPLLCARITEIPQLLLIKHPGEVSFSITFLKVTPDLSVDTHNFAAPELMTTWSLQHCTMY